MDTVIAQRIKEWTSPPFDSDTINEINGLLAQKNEKELAERFYATLEFGTGGLRGVIGAGTSRINIYTVGMATQGLANYINSRGRGTEGVVIARDSRRMSDIFAKDTASILAGNGIKVYMFDDVTPTPMCSFAIRHLGAVSGVVITASHNPPEYNGYKVYWDDGGQIVSPQDKEIIEEVNRISSIDKIKKMDFDKAVREGLLTLIGDDITGAYISLLEMAAFRRPGTESATRIVYTPLHGTGYKIIPKVLSHFGFSSVRMVEAQGKPDGNFPTVSYPNPEEPAAMAMAVDLAKRTDADIIMATDPDADRMGIGFKDRSGEYRLINGNQIGTMLEYYLLSRLSDEGKLPESPAVVKTIVTTDLQDTIAASFNCASDNVLTGFKWIAVKMKEYDRSGKTKFVFGGEESYGYLPVDFVRDKDAVSSCYFFAEMADWLRSKGSSLEEFLDDIYVRYGLYLEDLHSVTLKGMDGMEKITSIMKAFRESPPSRFGGVPVEKIRDILNLNEKILSSGEMSPVSGLPASNVLQYYLADGTKITMRPSGTEPKIKFYFSVNGKVTKDTLDAEKKALMIKLKVIKDEVSAAVARV